MEEVGLTHDADHPWVHQVAAPSWFRNRTRWARWRPARSPTWSSSMRTRCRTSRNLKKTNTVIFDGKVVDRSYHANYDDVQSSRRSEQPCRRRRLPWVVVVDEGRSGRRRRARGATEGAGRGGVADPAESPQPAIQTIDPFIVTQGHAVCHDTSDRHAQGDQLRAPAPPCTSRAGPCRHRSWSPTELRFTLDAEALPYRGAFRLVVVNPAPVAPLYAKGMWGNGTSNQAHLIVNFSPT